MSFGEHLEELRVSLFKALAGVLVGFLVGLGCANYVVQVIQGPLKNALVSYYAKKAKGDLEKKYAGAVPPDLEPLLTEEMLIPGSMRLDLEGLLVSLREEYPQFREVDLKPFHFVRGDFTRTDVLGVKHSTFGEFCRRIVRGAEALAGTPERSLYEMLSEEQRAEMRELAGAEELSPEQELVVVALVNWLAEREEVYRDKAFASFYSDHPMVKALRAKLEKAHEADDARRLNRLLISAALPELRPARMTVLEVPTWQPNEVRVQALKPHEAFMIFIKAAIIFGLVIASPWVFWQIWAFVGAGLYPHEKRYVYIYLPFSLVLFLLGAATAFFFVFQPVLDFLFSFNAWMEIDPDPRISEWIGFVLMLPLGFGVSFQLPLVMLLLERIGIVTIQTYLEKWRISILVIFIISMFLTPADPISMMLMAGPLSALYFLGIALCRWMPRGRNPFDEVYEP